MKKAVSKPKTGVKRTGAADVEAYLAAQPKAMRDALEHLRSVIKSAAPTATEVISYQIPTFKLQGSLVAYAAFAKHCSFFVMSPPLMEQFAKELAPFSTAKATLHFTPEHPLPTALVKKLVKARIKENESRKSK